MKIGDPLPGGIAAAPDWGTAAERRTRARVCRQVLERGPVTAAQLAGELDLTPAAVRRHLDALLADGYICVWHQPSTSRRGRGRPARRFVGTDSGHGALSTAYDDLAASALRHLEEILGPGAVRRFADIRVAELEQRYSPVIRAAGSIPVARAVALARALTEDGYAASIREVPPGAGAQLCQGHCPVQHVAREFPQLCEAETEAFSRLLGVHVQRLATLAHGEHVCTTHIPSAATAADTVPAAPARSPVPAAAGTGEPAHPDGPARHERTVP
ncbi:MAG: helix-turn-helix domain-containing protein [Kineosporiaceae bacterium]